MFAFQISLPFFGSFIQYILHYNYAENLWKRLILNVLHNNSIK